MNTFNYLIVACDNNGVIGLNNKMPWHLPEDLKRFRKLTINQTVIMGKNTFESIKKPLEDRINIVISSTMIDDRDDIRVATSIDDAIKIAKTYNNKNYIIGGSTIYEQFLKLNKIDVIELTIINEPVTKGDAFFPVQEILNSTTYGQWILNKAENAKKYQFLTYFKK